MAADPCPLIRNRGLGRVLTFAPYWRNSWRWNACATSSSQPLGISGIHFSTEAGAASVGEAVGEGGWGAAPGARRAAAALSLGIGSGIANDNPATRTGVCGAGMGLGVVIARRRTSANSSRSGTWGEVRSAAARMTGTRTGNCCEPGVGSSKEAGTALRTASANAGGVDRRPPSLVAMDKRGCRALMKLRSRTPSSCRCAAAECWIYY